MDPLAAIVIVAVADMERIGHFLRLRRIRRLDFLPAVFALLGVLVLGILPGLGLAVGISLAVIGWQAGAGRLQLSGRAATAPATPADTGIPAATDGAPTAAGSEPVNPGSVPVQTGPTPNGPASTRSSVAELLVAHPQQMLFLVNAAEIRERVEAAAAAAVHPHRTSWSWISASLTLTCRRWTP